jgi:DeoR family glycerol-3-phosphate regulon repressor
MVEMARLEHLDRLYTDLPPPEPFARLLAQAGVPCIVAAAG